MRENPSQRRSRSRSDRAERLYAARELGPSDEPEMAEDTPRTIKQPQNEAYVPVDYDSAAFMPNEPEQPVYAQPEEVDYSAYYRPESEEGMMESEDDSQPTFAPPIKLDDFYGYAPPVWPQEEENEPSAAAQGNVYRPREATWSETTRMQVMGTEPVAYQVHAEDMAPRRLRRRHPLRKVWVVLVLLALLAVCAWLLREPIREWMDAPVQPTEEPFVAVTTPQPVKAYDAAPAMAIADGTRNAISRLSGTVSMEPYAVTEKHVLTRNQRADGMYDFYLFTADEGRLLCYFEAVGPQDMLPQENDTFYVKQAPWLVAANGSALIRTADLEATIGEQVSLHPLYNGWALLETETGALNYINTAGQLINRLWFSRAFPFTGDYTAAYVDTGVTADPEQRYLLYVLGKDSTVSRWQATADMEDLVACAGGMAYMNNGELYALPDTSAPLATADYVDAYLDCDALVVRDAASGKVGLFVHGQQHYDFAYDRIAPVESDITWGEKVLQGAAGSFAVHAVQGAAYPQPLSHSFVLEKDGKSEYVALSTNGVYPIRLDGEF